MFRDDVLLFDFLEIGLFEELGGDGFGEKVFFVGLKEANPRIMGFCSVNKQDDRVGGITTRHRARSFEIDGQVDILALHR